MVARFLTQLPFPFQVLLIIALLLVIGTGLALREGDNSNYLSEESVGFWFGQEFRHRGRRR